MDFTFDAAIAAIAERAPDSTALVLGERRSSFADLLAGGRRLAAWLDGQGVSGPRRVGFLGRNGPEFFELAVACSLQGAVLVGLNWRLAPAELTRIVEDADLALVVASPDLLPRLDDVDDLPVLTTGPILDAVLEAQDAQRAVSRSRPEDVLLQFYSSGTTGAPKGTLITHANLAFSQVSGRRLYGMDATSVNLVPSPLFHIGGAGYATTAMTQGATTVLVPDADPTTLLEAIERERVTHAFMVPAVIQGLVGSERLATSDVTSLRTVAYGGAPMSEALLQAALAALGCDFLGVYGMTETAGTVVALDAADHDPQGPRAHLLRSIGRPLAWVGDVEVRDPVTLERTGPGAVGEIWVRSGQVTPGYWNQPEASREALTEDGWLRTGDAAYTDEEGYLFLHDRIKDMVISGGENVFPAEVENVLAHHPSVLEVAVIGVPSQRWGESVKALVVPREGAEVDADELIAFTRERLAHYKCPRAVETVPKLPRNAAGKVLKKDLRHSHGSALS